MIRQCETEELNALGLNAPQRPLVPKGLEKLPVPQRLQAIQVMRPERVHCTGRINKNNSGNNNIYLLTINNNGSNNIEWVWTEFSGNAVVIVVVIVIKTEII